MIVLSINNKKYNLPTKIKEITYRVGKDVEDIIEEYPDMNIEGKKWILSSLLGVGYDIVDMILDSQIELIIDNHILFDDKLSLFQSEYIKIGGVLYKYNDKEIYTVDEYAQMEMFLINKDFQSLFLSLYKKVKYPFFKVFYKNSKKFEDINYFQYKLSIYFYMKWKNDILNEYSISSHNNNIPDNQQDGEYKLSPIEQFGVYHIVMQIVEGKLSEYKEWMEEDIRVLFKYILYQNLNSQK